MKNPYFSKKDTSLAAIAISELSTKNFSYAYSFSNFPLSFAEIRISKIFKECWPSGAARPKMSLFLEYIFPKTDIWLFEHFLGAKNCSSTDGRMPDERMWFYFVYASLGTYFSALLLAGLNYAVKGNYY